MRHEVYLDATTGDYFSFVQTVSKSKKVSELLENSDVNDTKTLSMTRNIAHWVPCGNVGMHHNQLASFAVKGNFMTKTKTYRAKAIKSRSTLYISKLFETQ